MSDAVKAVEALIAAGARFMEPTNRHKPTADDLREWSTRARLAKEAVSPPGQAAFDDRYPLHNALLGRLEERGVVQSTIDWLEEHGLTLCQFDAERYGGEYTPLHKGKADLIGEIMGIDNKAFNEEKDRMYADLTKPKESA